MAGYETSNVNLFGKRTDLSEAAIVNIIENAITDGSSNPLYQSLASVSGSTLTYKGSWIVNTAPILVDGAGNLGDVWIASTSGTFNTKPISPGDWLIYNGSIWQHFDHPDVEPPIPTNNPGFYYAGNKTFKQIDYSEIASKPVLGTAAASNIGGLVDQILPLVSDITSGNQVLITIGVGGNWYANPTDTGTAFNKNFGTTAGTVVDGGIHTTAINNLTTTINGKANTIHTHDVSNITGLETALTNYSQNGHQHFVTDIDGLSGTLSAITGTLQAKADISHTHTTANITDFTTAIDLRLQAVAPSVHTHEIGDVNGLQVSLNALAANDSGHDVQIANITDVLVVSKADVIHTHEITDINGLEVELTGKINMTDLPLNLVDVLNGQSLRALVDRGTTTWVNEHITNLIGPSTTNSVIVDDIAGTVTLTASGIPAINIGDGSITLTGNLFINGSAHPLIESSENPQTENDLLVFRSSDGKYINKQFIRDDLNDSLITTYSGNKINTLVSGLVSGMVFAGTWDASTNVPFLADGDNVAVGRYYIVSVAGNGNNAALGLPDIIDWETGDWVLKTAPNRWEKIDNSNSVISVNAKVGTVNLNTDDIPEGPVNLYYTDARFDTRLSSKTTDNLTEGTNLYYTDARFDTRLTSKTTDNLTEGTNLYYTDARFDTRLALKTTDNVAEGAVNKYFTGQIGSSISAGDTSIVITDAGTGSINTRVDNSIVSTYTPGLCSFTAPLTSTAQLKATANLPSTTNTTGSLVVTGGVGISGDVRSGGSFHGNNLTVASTINCGGLNCDAINIASATYSSNFAGILHANNQLRCNQTTQSTSNTTGALVVSVGGVGVVGNINAGGTIQTTNTQESTGTGTGALIIPNGGAGIGKNLFVGGTIQTASITPSTGIGTGAFICQGGVGIYLDLNIGGIIQTTNTQQSTGIGTGAFICQGGAGIYKNLNIGGNTFTAGDLVVGQNLFIQGDLTVQGTQTVLNVETVTIEDPILTLSSGNAANANDIGFYGQSNNGVGPVSSGLIRKASDKSWYLTKDHISVPLAGVNYSTHLGDLINNSTQSNTYYYGTADQTHRTVANAFTIDTYTNNILASTLHNNQIYQFTKPVVQPGVFLRFDNLGITYQYTGVSTVTEYPLTLKTTVAPVVLSGIPGSVYGVINHLEPIDITTALGTFTAFKNNNSYHVGSSYLINLDYVITWNKKSILATPVSIEIKHGINQGILYTAGRNVHIFDNAQISGSISTVITLTNFNEYIYPMFYTGGEGGATLQVNTFRMTITKL
jgi:hypothetical protein